MSFIVDNWYIAVAFLAALAMIAAYVYHFAGLPSEEQLEKVREWLLWAVTNAEKELGSGTGQLKLRAVYDMFLQRFPKLVAIIPFAMFSDLVDDALEEMRVMLAKNDAVAAIVEGESK